MDRFGRRNGLSSGYIIGTAGAVVSAGAIIAGSFSGFLLGALLMGAARASAEQSRYVAAEVQPLSRKAKAMGLIVSAGSIGAIGGPLLVVPSGQLALWFGLNSLSGAFIISTFLIGLALIITLVGLRPDPLAVSQTITPNEQPVDAAGLEDKPPQYVPCARCSKILPSYRL